VKVIDVILTHDHLIKAVAKTLSYTHVKVATEVHCILLILDNAEKRGGEGNERDLYLTDV